MAVQRTDRAQRLFRLAGGRFAGLLRLSATVVSLVLYLYLVGGNPPFYEHRPLAGGAAPSMGWKGSHQGGWTPPPQVAAALGSARANCGSCSST